MTRSLLTTLVVLVASATCASAQIVAGVEARRDRFAYRFENPSSIDTSELVPHFFEQRYHLDSFWVVLTADYRLGVPWETSAALTPERRSVADDYDTFFDPDGTVWVSGTTGDALMRSVRISHRATLGRFRAVGLTGGYRFRWDRATFRLSHKTVTRNGAVFQAVDLPGREFTTGQLHEVFVGMSLMAAPVAGRWRLTVDGDLAPGAIARLLVQLPDKYPGADLIFRTTALTTSARAGLVRTNTAWPVELWVDAGRAWNYRSGGKIARESLGARVAFGRTW